jgi:hypothetical protein
LIITIKRERKHERCQDKIGARAPIDANLCASRSRSVELDTSAELACVQQGVNAPRAGERKSTTVPSTIVPFNIVASIRGTVAIKR